MVVCEKTNDGLQIRLLPNRSATWKQTSRVLIGICGLSILIAIGWAIQGAWMILPFAGLEVALLSYFVYKVSARTYQQEILHFGTERICVEGGSSQPDWNYTFDCADAEFVITNPRHFLSPATVVINSPTHKLRLGDFLNREDIDELIEVIRASGISYRITGKTLVHALEAFDLS